MKDEFHLGQTINLFESILKVSLIDQTASDISNADEKVGEMIYEVQIRQERCKICARHFEIRLPSNDIQCSDQIKTSRFVL